MHRRRRRSFPPPEEGEPQGESRPGEEPTPPSRADLAPYPTISRHIVAGAVAGVAAFGAWGLIEPNVRLTRLSGTTAHPFPLFSAEHLAYTAIAVTVYAILGVAAGALLGLKGGLLDAARVKLVHGHSLRPVPTESGDPLRMWRRPPAPRFAPYLSAFYLALGSWMILSFAAFYYLNRLVPGSFRSPRSMRMSVMGIVVALVLAAIIFTIGWIARRASEGRPAIHAAGRRAGLTLLAVLLVSALTTGVLFLRESRGQTPAAAAAGMHEVRRNVVLLSIDALRADHLSCYGYGRRTSPALDALAGQGVLFERAYTQAPSSTPAHASMLTGLFPTAHGAVTNGDVLPDDVTGIAERFRAAGWRTGGFLTNPWLSSQFGFAQGFGVWVESGVMQKSDEVYPALFASNLFIAQAAGKLRTDDLSYLRAMRWVRADTGQPFFLFLHILDPHAPYEPPPPFRGEFEAAGMSDAEATTAAYDEEIRSADAKVGRFMEFLGAIGISDDTIVAITGDHGENMAEHEPHYAHGTLYDTNLHVPLILVAPGLVPAGRRIPAPVASIDIVPTLLALAGARETLDGQPVEGEDLTAIMTGAAPADTARVIFSQRAHSYAAVRANWKIIWEPGAPVPALYELASDPLETRDVAADNPTVCAELMTALNAWVEQENQHARTPRSQVDQLDPATRERLKAIGYLR